MIENAASVVKYDGDVNTLVVLISRNMDPSIAIRKGRCSLMCKCILLLLPKLRKVIDRAHRRSNHGGVFVNFTRGKVLITISNRRVDDTLAYS